MKTEDKKLLFQDLCARLPYNVKIQIGDLSRYEVLVLYPEYINSLEFDYISIKPYLRPISSMTEEEKEEFRSILLATAKSDRPFGLDTDWLNKNMFDYRGLIEKGLALEAPEGMYK